MKHFKLTDQKLELGFVVLYRIEATQDIGYPHYINKGTLGGYIEKESNLQDNAWVSGGARVYGDARVHGSARVYGDAQVYGDARVHGSARVYGNAQKKLIFIGCKMFETKKALKITQGQAIKLGLPKEYYKPYMAMIKGAIKLVK